MIPAHSVIPDVLAQVLRNAPLTPEKVSFAWRTAVGPAIGRVSSVTLGDNGVLLVTVTERHWGPAIARSQGLILQRLATLLGPDVVTKLDTQGA